MEGCARVARDRRNRASQIVLMNVLVAFVIDAYTTQYDETVEQQQNEGAAWCERAVSGATPPCVTSSRTRPPPGTCASRR